MAWKTSAVKSILLLMFLLIALGAGTVPASEQEKNRKPPVSKRRQMQMIREGIRSGTLTKEEAHKLLQGQKEASRMIRQARADGVVTEEERKAIRNKLEQENKKIPIKRHGRNR